MGDDLNPKNRGLGRGLDALFGDEEKFSGASEAPSGGLNQKTRINIGVEMLTPGAFQPRRVFEEEALHELAESIRTHGLLQPLLVRVHPDVVGMYEIIAGERRWRAAQVAQLHEVPVIVKDFSDEEAAEIALIENVQREDLNPVEEAQGYKRLIDEYGHTQEKLAGVIGKSRSYIANSVRLLNLPEKVLKALEDGKLTSGHARALITADDPEALAKQIISGGLNVRETEDLSAKSGGKGKKGAKKAKKAKDPDVLAFEEDLTSKLGMHVTIDMRTAQKGTLKIDFASLEQLDAVLAALSHGRAV